MNAQASEVGLTRQERQRFSLARLLAAIAPGADVRARNAGGFEIEACIAARSTFNLDTPGYPLPDEFMLGRALTSTGGVGTGGAVVETEVETEFWGPALRAQSKVRGLGATVIPPEQPANSAAIPIISTGGSAAAVAENAAGAASDPAFSLVTYAPNTIRAFIDCSRRLLMVAAAAETIVRADLVYQIAEIEDRYAIQGSGAGGQPTGLINTAGLTISALGTNGLAPTYAGCIDCIRQVGFQKGVVGPAVGWITSTKGACTMRNVTKTASWGFLWDDPDTGDPAPRPDGYICGYPAMMSENVPSNLVKGTSGAVCSALVFGNWADLYIFEFSPPTILPDQYTLSNTGAVRFNIFKEVDTKPRRVKSFCAIVDMLAS
jgi:HK97 family phage major capsid protein